MSHQTKTDEEWDRALESYGRAKQLTHMRLWSHEGPDYNHPEEPCANCGYVLSSEAPLEFCPAMEYVRWAEGAWGEVRPARITEIGAAMLLKMDLALRGL